MKLSKELVIELGFDVIKKDEVYYRGQYIGELEQFISCPSSLIYELLLVIKSSEEK